MSISKEDIYKLIEEINDPAELRIVYDALSLIKKHDKSLVSPKGHEGIASSEFSKLFGHSGMSNEELEEFENDLREIRKSAEWSGDSSWD